MNNIIEYKDMCTVKQGTINKAKSGNELIEECIKNCDELIKSIENFKVYLELQKE